MFDSKSSPSASSSIILQRESPFLTAALLFRKHSRRNSRRSAIRHLRKTDRSTSEPIHSDSIANYWAAIAQNTNTHRYDYNNNNNNNNNNNRTTFRSSTFALTAITFQTRIREIGYDRRVFLRDGDGTAVRAPFCLRWRNWGIESIGRKLLVCDP